jgi:hypothetical protein
MKPIATKHVVFSLLLAFAGTLALAGCSDEKSGTPPTSPTAAKQQVATDGGTTEGTGAPPSGGGGW